MKKDELIQWLREQIKAREQWMSYLTSKGSGTQSLVYAGERVAFIEVLQKLTPDWQRVLLEPDDG